MDENIENNLFTKLGQKLDKEMLDLRAEIKEQGVEKAISKAYELTVKNEIKDCILYDKDLSKAEIKALLSRKNILDETYQDWLKDDGNLREDINYTLDNSIENITEDFEKNKKNKNYER